MVSAHVDTFARDHLPPAAQWPEFLFDLPELQFPPQLNCATELLDRQVANGLGAQLCIQAPGVRWTYADLLDRANRVADVLVKDMGLQPGNRVLLRSPNNPMLAACWFGVVKAGGIAVATMPLLRAKELKTIIDKARVTHALCDAALAQALADATLECPQLMHTRWFNHGQPSDPPINEHVSLEAAMAQHSGQFTNVNTAADDTCILAFTSGTTGVPKATMHFHRDVMAMCACWPKHVLRPQADDIFIGSPPLAFTFGLGGLLLFPMSVGASTVLLDKAAPQPLLDGVVRYGATVMFTAPTSYRAIASLLKASEQTVRMNTLRLCVSAGEALPAATRTLWRDAASIELIDGIGATELLHIFISADAAHARPGATGQPVPGYRACVVDHNMRPLPPRQVGQLAVKGPTGCRYLDDERQGSYVRDGWNLTGDAYWVDEDGYFYFHARSDDMIISAGYNIASPEVEDALMLHPSVAECGVIGVPDDERGQIVKAFVVLRSGYEAGPDHAQALQDFVKLTIAPYKYPRAVVFVAALPRTETGKLQRYRLHHLPSTSP